ncbi:hypothetical protein RFI_03867, partial [Reticulomyxa filosa]
SIEYNKKALGIGKQTFGQNNLDVTLTCYNLGFSYNRKGDHRKAIHWFSKSVNIRLGLLDPYDLCMTYTYKMVAESYYCNNELNNAIDAFEKAIAIFLKQITKATFNELTYCYDKLSAIYMENSQHTQAIDTATKLLQLRSKQFGRSHADVASSYETIADLSFQDGNIKQEIQNYNLALRTFSIVHGDGHRDAARNYINLGICDIGNHQLTYALKKFEKGLDIYNKILLPFDTDFIFVYEQFAILYQKQKRWDLASQYRHKVAEVQAKTNDTAEEKKDDSEKDDILW